MERNKGEGKKAVAAPEPGCTPPVAHIAILEVLISYLFWETAGMLTSLECLRLHQPVIAE